MPQDHRAEFAALSAVPPSVIDLGDGREILLHEWAPKWRDVWAPEGHVHVTLSGLLRQIVRAPGRAGTPQPPPAPRQCTPVAVEPAAVLVLPEDGLEGSVPAFTVCVSPAGADRPLMAALALSRAAALALAEKLLAACGGEG